MQLLPFTVAELLRALANKRSGLPRHLQFLKHVPYVLA